MSHGQNYSMSVTFFTEMGERLRPVCNRSTGRKNQVAFKFSR